MLGDSNMRNLVMFSFMSILLPAFILGGSLKDNSSLVEHTAIGFSKTIDLDFETALTKVKAELKKEGFGVLTEVDVSATMKKKLDVDFRPYHILGVCNPPLAHKSIQAEEQIGLLLPCKFIVYVNDNEQTVVAAADPVKMMAGLSNENLTEIANSVQAKFMKVLEIL
jgi:uncharacterized protein (DUF302 family)